MVFKKKSKQDPPAEPIAHPASFLTNVNPEIISQLVKLPKYLPTEKEPYVTILRPLQSDWKYAFVFNWLNLFRGCIKLNVDQFNIHVWEEEILGITAAYRLVDKLKLLLMNSLLKFNFRTNDIADFDQNLTVILGEELTTLLEENNIHLSDYQEDYEPESEQEEDDETTAGNEAPAATKKIRFFDFLPLSVKIDIFYLLIQRISYLDIFKKFAEKFDRPLDLRIEPVFNKIESGESITETSYFLFEDNRLYSQKLVYSPVDANTKKQDIAFAMDPEFEWECLTHDFYELNEKINQFKVTPGHKVLAQSLIDVLDDMAGLELRWKKNYQSRIRERNMQNLLMNRKRSSRIQQNEERKKVSDLEQRDHEDQLIRQGAALRASKRLKLNEKRQDKTDDDWRLDRERRLQKRHELVVESSSRDVTEEPTTLPEKDQALLEQPPKPEEAIETPPPQHSIQFMSIEDSATYSPSGMKVSIINPETVAIPADEAVIHSIPQKISGIPESFTPAFQVSQETENPAIPEYQAPQMPQTFQVTQTSSAPQLTQIPHDLQNHLSRPQNVESTPSQPHSTQDHLNDSKQTNGNSSNPHSSVYPSN